MKYKHSHANCFISIMQAADDLLGEEGELFKMAPLSVFGLCGVGSCKQEPGIVFKRIKWDQRRLYWCGFQFLLVLCVEISSSAINPGGDA